VNQRLVQVATESVEEELKSFEGGHPDCLNVTVNIHQEDLDEVGLEPKQVLVGLFLLESGLVSRIHLFYAGDAVVVMFFHSLRQLVEKYCSLEGEHFLRDLRVLVHGLADDHLYVHCLDEGFD